MRALIAGVAICLMSLGVPNLALARGPGPSHSNHSPNHGNTGGSWNGGAWNGGHGYYYGGYNHGYYGYPFYGFGLGYPYGYGNYGYPYRSGYDYSYPYDYGYNYQQPVIANRTEVVVRVPNPQAQVSLDGYQTAGSGYERVFAPPNLEPGYNYYYNVEATWMENGQLIRQSRQVRVVPGQVTMVDFTRPESVAAPNNVISQ
jgi:uncharacterized protein (TIGR03000 family)